MEREADKWRDRETWREREINGETNKQTDGKTEKRKNTNRAIKNCMTVDRQINQGGRFLYKFNSEVKYGCHVNGSKINCPNDI